MSSGYGRKQNFGQKVKGTLRRIFMLSALGGTVIGGPAYYNYGTIHEADVKIKDVKQEWVRYDSKKGESVYDYKLVTDKGMVLENKNTLLHFKFNSKDIQDQVSDGRDAYNDTPSYSLWGSTDNNSTQKPRDESLNPANKVFHIKYYGARIDVPFIHTFPNVLSVQEVSKEELQARAKAEADARKAQQQAAHQGQQQAQQPQQNGQQQPGQVNPAAPGVLSGTTITFETVVDGERVTITAPIEAAGKVQVNKVAPLVPPKGPGS